MYCTKRDYSHLFFFLPQASNGISAQNVLNLYVMESLTEIGYMLKVEAGNITTCLKQKIQVTDGKSIKL